MSTCLLRWFAGHPMVTRMDPHPVHPRRVLRQPDATEFVIGKVSELPTRTRPGQEGYDAIGIIVVDCPNDGRPVALVKEPPALQANHLFSYESMIRRVANQYDFFNANV